MSVQLLHVSRVGEAGILEGSSSKSSSSGEEAIGVEGFLISRDLYYIWVGSCCLSGLSECIYVEGV